MISSFMMTYPLLPDDVTALFSDYDVIVFDDVNPGDYDVTNINLFLSPLVRLLPKNPANSMHPILVNFVY